MKLAAFSTALAFVAVTARHVVKVPGWPDAPPSFSWATVAHDMVHSSGLTGKDQTAGGVLVSGGIANETRQALHNLEAILATTGIDLEDVVSCSVSLTNISRDFHAMNAVYTEFFSSLPPSRVTSEVSGLLSGASVEIQCSAGLGHDRTVVSVPGWPDIATFSKAIKSGDQVFVSGLQGKDYKTGQVVSGGVANETAQLLRNLDTVLRAAGSGPDQVLNCEMWLADIVDLKAMGDAYKSFWPTSMRSGGLPSRVSVQASRLVGEGKIEIRCTAASGGEAKIVKVPGWIPSTAPFSTAVRTNHMVYVSGMQGKDYTTSGALVEGGIAAETTQALTNIASVAKAAGSDISDVVLCEVSLPDLGDFKAMNEAYVAFWPTAPPSRVALAVPHVPGAAKAEIACKVALPYAGSVVV